MKSFTPDFAWQDCRTLNEALTLMAKKPGFFKPFAGGTDLMVLFEAGKLTPGNYLNLWNLAELKNISVQKDHVAIGALSTYADILADKTLTERLPMLGEAAKLTGAAAIQNRGTIGGNIANASPAADTPPALLVYDAKIELVSLQGSRTLPYREFHLDYKKTAMRNDELIKAVHVPFLDADYRQSYRKVGTRKAQAISKICLASVFQVTADKVIQDFRLAFASVGPVPIFCPETAKAIIGEKVSAKLIDKACSVLDREITPIDDIRSTKEYRLNVAKNLLCDLLGAI